MLAARDAGVPWHPASLTKIMTLHVALSAVRDGLLSPDAPVTISAKAAAAPPSKSGLPAGSKVPLQDALRAMAVRSANDLAIAVAEAVAGTEEAFVRMMNDAARGLGLTATRFENASGLHHPRQVTTARDMAVLSIAVRRMHPEVSEMTASTEAAVGGRRVRTTNALLSSYPGANGMKTGYICASGFNIVVTADRDGRGLVAVVLGERSAAERNAKAAALLDAGFKGRGTADAPNLPDFAITRPGTPVDLNDHACGRAYRSDRETPPMLDVYGSPRF